MSGRRSSYEQKALREREAYFRNTIRRPLGPTIEDSAFDADSTDVEAPPTESPQRRYTPTRRPPSNFSVFFKEHWPTIVVGSVLLPLLAFLLYQMFGLNREVGEMKMRLDEAHQQQERFEKQIDKLSDKLDSLTPTKNDKH